MIGRTLTLTLAAGVAVILATPASALTAGDVGAGQRIERQLQGGQLKCAAVSDAEFAQVGEAAVQRLVGSPTSHQALDRRSVSMMGAVNTQRMHTLMGRSYAGCRTLGSGVSMMGSNGMMGGTTSWAAMTGARDWSWMRDGTWRHMSSADWRAMGNRWMGPEMMAFPGGTERGATSDASIAVLALLIVGGLGWLSVRRRNRRVPRAEDPETAHR